MKGMVMEKVTVTIIQITRDRHGDLNTGDGEQFCLEGTPTFEETVKALKGASFKQIFGTNEAFRELDGDN